MSSTRQDIILAQSVLAAILINWCQADIIEFRNSSVNASDNQLTQDEAQYTKTERPTQTEKDGLAFWTGYPSTSFRRLQFLQTSSRGRVYQPVGEIGNIKRTNFHSSKMKKNIKSKKIGLDDKIKSKEIRLKDKIKSRDIGLDDNYSRLNKNHYMKYKENVIYDRWANRTYIIRSDHSETNSKIREVNDSLRIPRMHKFMRPALLDNLHKTLSKVDEILKKPHFRRLVQVKATNPNLREGPILSTEESLYRGKSTSYSPTIHKWPKVITRSKTWRDYEASRNPKGIGKAIARNYESKNGDKSTTNYVHLVSDGSTKGATHENDNQTTTEKSRFGRYLSPYSIKAHLADFTSNFRNANISVEVIGRTVSYNDIVLLKVTEKKASKNKYFRAEDKYLDEGPEKKIVFIVHGLSVMGMHFLPCMLDKEPLKKLMSYYFAHLDKFDIFLIPMANPDGLTMSVGESWNKNTSPQTSCSGVCLDRNFDVMWNSSRTTSSCSQQYPGPSPFSEEETRAVRDVIHKYSHKIVAYLHLHSATYNADVFKGDAVLYPRGYTEVQSDDDKYIDLRGEIDEAMKNASFQVLTVAVDTLYNWYGKVSGSSVDYASSVYGIPYAMELVMQIYIDDPAVESSEEAESAVALREVWRRVIDVIFHSVHKYVHNAGE